MTNMKNSLVWLFEDDKYKIYSHFEYVYLKDKSSCHVLDDWKKADDSSIGWIYGEPTGALILNKRFAVVVGSGIYIYDITNGKLKEYYNEPDRIKWIETVYQEYSDKINEEFRFVAFNDNDDLRVFRFNIKNEQLEEIK